MTKFYSLKSRLYLFTILASGIFLILMMINAAFTYYNLLKNEEEKITIYSDYLIDYLEREIVSYADKLQSDDSQNYELIETLFENMIEPKFYEWQVLVTDKKGQLLFHTHQEIDLSEPMLQDFSSYPSVQMAFTGESGFKPVRLDNIVYYTTSRFVYSVGWLVVVQVPFQMVFNRVLTMMAPSLTSLLSILTMLLLMLFAGIKYFLTPVVTLTRAMSNYNKGKIYETIDKSDVLQENQRDEISDAIDTYNTMIEERTHLQLQLHSIEKTEKERLGHFFNDELNRELTQISYKLEILHETVKDHQARPEPVIENISKMLNKLLSRSRQFAQEIGPISIFEDNLLEAVDSLLNRMKQIYQVNTNFEHSDDLVIINDFIIYNLYGIIVEAVKNSCKHSGTQSINVEMVKSGLDIIIKICDSGIGFDVTKQSGNGIRLIYYRASLINADINFISNEKQGTCLEIMLNITNF